MFGDGHVRLDLQPRDDRRLQPLRRGFHLMQHAVNPVTKAKISRKRLQVNVRSPHLERIHDDLVHQLDQRGVRFDRAAVVRSRHPGFDMFLREFLDHVFEPAVLDTLLVGPVILVQRGLDVRLRCHTKIDLRPQQMRQTVDRVEVRRVRQCHGEIVAVFEHRHHAILLCDVPGNGGNDIVVDAHLGQIDHLRPEMGSLGLRDIGGADDFVGQHQIHHADSGGLGFSPERGNLRGGYEAKVHQHVHQIIVFFSHGLVLHHTMIVNWSKHQINDLDNNVNGD